MSQALSQCQHSEQQLPAYLHDGQIIIGGLIPVHEKTVKQTLKYKTKPPLRTCEKFYTEKYQYVLAMLFAINEINANPTLMPNLTLGYEVYDSCYSDAAAVDSVMSYLSRKQSKVPNYSCASAPPKLSAVVGDSPSSGSIAVARILGLIKFPQISYASALPTLADKIQFPSFVRTVGTVDSQPVAVVEMIKHFNWSWVGIVSSNNDYGDQGSQKLRTEMAKNGICVAFAKTLSTPPTKGSLDSLISAIHKTKTNVIVLYAYATELIAFFQAVIDSKIAGKIWIAVGSWLPSAVFTQKELWATLNGTIGLAKYSANIPGFGDFLYSINPAKYPNDIFIREFWEQAFRCKWRENSSTYGVNTTFCTGKEDLTRLDSSVYDTANFRLAVSVYTAVYAVAHAIHDMMSCQSGRGPFWNGSCANFKNFQPWQLFYYIKYVQFINSNGERVAFDEKGELKGLYDVLNWHMSHDLKGGLVKVGIFDDWGPKGQKLVLDEKAIIWGEKYTQVPPSVCCGSCLPGFRKAPREGEPFCCYDCIPCSDGEISNETDATDCMQCPDDQWSNEKRVKCIPKVIEFLSYKEPLGLALSGVASICSLLTLSVLFIFIRFRDTPLVKANNRSLSYLLLVALLFCFLCSFLFIGRPATITCLIRQAIFGITFSLCVSCIFAKTITVVIAFNATKPNSNLRKWVGSSIPNSMIGAGSSIQTVICASWVIAYPSSPDLNTKATKGVITVECKDVSMTFFYIMLGFLGFLAILTLLVAFLARNLPDGFNETKFITFSMLVFTSVWISFIPAYVSTRGKYMVAVEIFAILSSSLGLICCIFAPKCHIIILRPHMNTREFLVSKNQVGRKN
ncbi:PREDICTED: extracellular calcium-sensing receptor-like [Nanorana parkeri]|uniref:extracellular calcium-sensing receptor-like n=1 Tax=Nanorana parkeri TaxID=125878 RepID=UPI0008548D1D|nr:PREDICTED: extracellular calcium-sensing receptor-like [Nanorana parkeri]